MTKKEIIDGLKMTMGLITFDPSTGEDIDPDDLNDLNRTTYDACKGAVELLEAQERKYTFGNDEFNLEYAYHDCKLVFDGITDDDSFQEADTGLILYYANEIIYALHEALEGKDANVPSNNILRHPSCKNRTSLGNCDPVGGFCSSVPKDICAKYYVPDTNVGDIISRQNTITSIRDYMVNPKEAISEHPDDILKYNSGLLSAVQAVNDMPSAQQEPKSPLYYGDGYSEGKMVYDIAECPNCGYIYDEGDQVWGEPYCPHCGQALDWYMKGEQDE